MDDSSKVIVHSMSDLIKKVMQELYPVIHGKECEDIEGLEEKIDMTIINKIRG